MVRFVIPGLELEEQQEREESWAPEERGVIKCPLTSARAGNLSLAPGQVILITGESVPFTFSAVPA